MQDEKPVIQLSPQAYAVLMAVAEKSRHGYEIMKSAEEFLGQDIPTATLYRHIRHFVEGGLIEDDDEKNATSDDPRRRYYKLTGLGQRAFASETHRYYEMAEKAQRIQRGMQPAFYLGGA